MSNIDIVYNDAKTGIETVCIKGNILHQKQKDYYLIKSSSLFKTKWLKSMRLFEDIKNKYHFQWSDTLIGLSIILLSFSYEEMILHKPTFISKSMIIYGLCVMFLLPITRKWRKDKANKRLRWFVTIFAIFYSLSLTIGWSIHSTQSLDLCISNFKVFLLCLIRITVYSLATYGIVSGIIVKIDSTNITIDSSDKKFPLSPVLLFCIFFLSRIPYLILCYPCIFDYDSAASLSSFSPQRVLYNHHPFFTSLLQKGAFEFGRYLGDPSLGFMFLSLFFITVTSLGGVYIFRVLQRFKTRNIFLWFFIIVYALFPLYSFLTIYNTKDGIFSYSVLFLITALIDLQGQTNMKKKPSWYIWAILSITSLMMCLSRHQGIYFIICQFFVVLFLYREYWKNLLASYLPPIAFYFVFTYILLPLWQVEKGGKQEIIGNLFQQVALCIIKHPQDITEKEQKAISNILNIPLDSIPYQFKYNITDPIKFHYRYIPLRKWNQRIHFNKEDEYQALAAFLQSWWSITTRHPITSLTASLCVGEGFFYNFGKPIFSTDSWWNKCPYWLPEYHFYHHESFQQPVMSIFYFMARKPFTELFAALSYYSWYFLLVVLILVYRRDFKGLAIFLPCILTMVLFVICPVVTFRYVAPIIISIPIAFIYCLSHLTYRKHE